MTLPVAKPRTESVGEGHLVVGWVGGERLSYSGTSRVSAFCVCSCEQEENCVANCICS